MLVHIGNELVKGHAQKIRVVVRVNFIHKRALLFKNKGLLRTLYMAMMRKVNTAVFCRKEFKKNSQYRLEVTQQMCYNVCKYYLLVGTPTDLSPLHYIHGGVARFNQGEFIDPLLREGYSTLSLGFVGIKETTKLIKNEDINTPLGHEFALKIVKRMRNTIEKWKQNSNIGFTLYAGKSYEPSKHFVDIDKKRFGDIEEITNKGYYTSSYMSDDKSIDIFSRLDMEKEFETYCNGGCYHVIDVQKLSQEQTASLIIHYIYDNLLYCCFKNSIDECKNCGYKGKLIMTNKSSYQCPNCNCKDKSKLIINKKIK